MPKLVLVMMMVAISACDNPAGQGVVGKLSKEQAARLENLNETQQAAIDARDYAFSSMIAPLINEKSKAIADKIAYPNCVATGVIPENDLTGAVNEQTIDGANCPISWFRRRGYRNNSMLYSDRLVVKKEDFQKAYAPLVERTLNGSYNLVIESGGGYRVSGNIQITRLRTLEYGDISGGITIGGRSSSGDNGAMVSLTLNGSNWSHVAIVNWDGRRNQRTYSIDGSKVDSGAFKLLFSAFELDKLMDNVINMK